MKTAIFLHFIMGAIAPKIIENLQEAICEYRESQHWLNYLPLYYKAKNSLYLWFTIAFAYVITYAVVIFISMQLLSKP